jgi:hypothetical protein
MTFNHPEDPMTTRLNVWLMARPVLAVLLVAGALVCASCGAKDDFSGSSELSKQPQTPQAAATSPSGATARSHKGLMVPNIPPPSNAGH